MNTRRLVRSVGVVATVVGLILLVGCPVEDDSVSVSERIRRFESAINAGGADAGRHLHPQAQGYDQAQTANFWQIPFPTNDGQSYSIGSPSRNDGTQRTYTSTITGGDYGTGGSTLEFVMREDGSDNWKIEELSRNPGGQIIPIQ